MASREITVNVADLPQFKALAEENDRLRSLLREVADWYEHPDGEPSSSDLLDRIWDVLA